MGGFSNDGDASRKHCIIRQLKREHSGLGEVGTDDEATFLVVTDFAETLCHGLKVGIWSNAVEFCHNVVTPYA